MHDVGKLLILSGLLILIIGVAFYFTDKGGIPFGRLPGDIVIRRDRKSVV